MAMDRRFTVYDLLFTAGRAGPDILTRREQAAARVEAELQKEARCSVSVDRAAAVAHHDLHLLDLSASEGPFAGSGEF